MSVGVEMSADLEGLLAALTRENWFEMLPIIADAYREQNDEAGEAVAWLIGNNKRPCWWNCAVDGEVNIAWGRRAAEEGEEGWPDETILETNYTNAIDDFLDSYYTPTIQPQLTAFVQVWLTGLRPC
jgi:hypothetical protein